MAKCTQKGKQKSCAAITSQEFHLFFELMEQLTQVIYFIVK